MSDATTDTCQQCGMPTDTDALRFLHERYHEDSVRSNQTKYVPFSALRALSEIMQDYADWCFAQMDGSADDSSEEVSEMPEINETSIVVDRGAVGVNHAFIVARGENVVAMSVGLSTKRAVVDCVGSVDDAPLICIGVGEDTLYPVDGVPLQKTTDVMFPEFRGWHVWCCSPDKYSVGVCLVRHLE